jgi:hypothetical protein
MTEFIIEAAELTPALRALAPLTRNLQKGEPVEGKACEMIYCRFTHEGELYWSQQTTSSRQQQLSNCLSVGLTATCANLL